MASSSLETVEMGDVPADEIGRAGAERQKPHE